jgi:ABC-type polar amino acid transport system ATPase subunit
LEREGRILLVVPHEIGVARELADTVGFLDNGMTLAKALASRCFTAPTQE